MPGNRWEEIVTSMTEAIRKGDLRRGERLPSETDFAAEWKISRMTAHRVMQELQDAGLVERRRGAGTVVSPRRRLQTIAALMHDTRLNPQASYLQGISEVLAGEYRLLLCDTQDSPPREAEALASLPQKADGAIVFPTSAPENTDALAQLSRVMPVVCVDRVPDGLTVDAVVTDEIESSREGLRLLTERGHRRIAYLTNDSFHVSSARGRLEAYVATLAEFGIASSPWLRTLSAEGRTFSEFAEQVRMELQSMLRSPEPPTAVFCVHDDYMAAALSACERMGLRVPQDLEILSVNDAPTLPIFHIEAVHRIVPQTLELGRLAARRLIDLAANPDQPAQTIRLRSEVIPASWA